MFPLVQHSSRRILAGCPCPSVLEGENWCLIPNYLCLMYIYLALEINCKTAQNWNQRDSSEVYALHAWSSNPIPPRIAECGLEAPEYCQLPEIPHCWVCTGQSHGPLCPPEKTHNPLFPWASALDYSRNFGAIPNRRVLLSPNLSPLWQQNAVEITSYCMYPLSPWWYGSAFS